MPHLPKSDEELVVAAQANDQMAIAALYDRYCKSLYAFVYGHVNHVEDAEDLTSDVMLRMVKSIGTYSQNSSFKTWLFGIARHAIADFWRGKYRMPETLVAEFVGEGTTIDLYQEVTKSAHPDVDQIVFDEQRARAQRVFEALSEQYRTVLQHRFLEQHTLEETAKAMNTSTGNVKVLQHRALKKAAELAKEIP